MTRALNDLGVATRAESAEADIAKAAMGTRASIARLQTATRQSVDVSVRGRGQRLEGSRRGSGEIRSTPGVLDDQDATAERRRGVVSAAG
mmetsp:Transcript_9335/g.34839  ORF Transcript_9335/g.34839 Transcript_9335/m.34839 type:complete len:90 (-) Transcript_9335:1347-1616(-)